MDTRVAGLLRRSSSAIRFVAILLLAASLLARGTIPSGWMPENGRMVLCTVAGPVLVESPFAPEETPEPKADAYCLFALGAHATPPQAADISAPQTYRSAAEPIPPATNHSLASLDAASARAPPFVA